MSAHSEESPTEATGQPGIMVTSQIVVTTGFDEKGDSQVWVKSDSGSLIERLGMLEAAKAHLISIAF